MPSYFNILECGMNLLNRLDVTYERACMVTQKEEYYTNTLETIIDHDDCHNVAFSNEKLRQAFSKIMAEMEEEECDAGRSANNVTIDTLIQSSVMTNTLRKKKNFPNKR